MNLRICLTLVAMLFFFLAAVGINERGIGTVHVFLVPIGLCVLAGSFLCPPRRGP